MILPYLLSLLLLADPEGFYPVDDYDGVQLEARPVKGSSFVELRATTVSPLGMEALCRGTWGDGSFDKNEEGLKARVVLEQTPTVRVTYEAFSTPVFADRDYVVKAVFDLQADRCSVDATLANERKPEQPGYVRIPVLHGLWVFTPTGDGKTKIVYRIHTEAGGSIPAFMAEGSRRKIARRWMKMVQERAKLVKLAPKPAAAPDAGEPSPRAVEPPDASVP
jgi:hypothetical protein